MDKKIFLIVGVLLAIGLAAGYFYIAKKNTGKSIWDRFNVLPSLQTNPLENKPDINPLDKVNPFQGIKVNPF